QVALRRGFRRVTRPAPASSASSTWIASSPAAVARGTSTGTGTDAPQRAQVALPLAWSSGKLTQCRHDEHRMARGMMLSPRLSLHVIDPQGRRPRQLAVLLLHAHVVIVRALRRSGVDPLPLILGLTRPDCFRHLAVLQDVDAREAAGADDMDV